MALVISADDCWGQQASKEGVDGKANATPSLELIAIRRKRDSGEIAWNSRGEIFAADDAWAAFPRIRGANFLHGFVFEAKGMDDGHVVAWDTAGLTWTGPDDSTPKTIGVFGRFDSPQTLTLRAGILGPWGPWQETNEEGTPSELVEIQDERTKGRYREVAGLIIAGEGTPVVFLNCGNNLRNLNDPAWVVPDAWAEVQAIDVDGRAYDRRGSGFYKGTQVPFFDLTAIKLAGWRFRLRPVEYWIEIKDVPLLPGESNISVVVKRP